MPAFVARLNELGQDGGGIAAQGESEEDHAGGRADPGATDPEHLSDTRATIAHITADRRTGPRLEADSTTFAAVDRRPAKSSCTPSSRPMARTFSPRLCRRAKEALLLAGSDTHTSVPWGSVSIRLGFMLRTARPSEPYSTVTSPRLASIPSAWGCGGRRALMTLPYRPTR